MRHDSAPPENAADQNRALPVSHDEDGIVRQALQKVLDSPAFSSSRRLSAFLAYITEAALSGRTDLDQYEIAEKVLKRHSDFNPLNDASVRKLASQVRQKLEEYYAGSGAADDIIITLPRRSYLPRFRHRDGFPESHDQDEPSTSDVDQDLTAPEELTGPSLPTAHDQARRPAMTTLVGIPLAAVSILCLLWVALGAARERPADPAVAGSVVINTARGDIRGPILDVHPGAVQLGPALGAAEEVMASLRFMPEYPTQQAGIMAFANADRFVRLGYHFKSRPMMEFGIETGGQYRGPESTYSYDLLAQTGLLRRLTIRRSGDRYEAFESSDGIHWRAFGQPLTMPAERGNTMAAIYAFNGRTDNPSAPALFHNFSVGLSFHHRAEGPLKVDTFPGWTVRSACPENVDATIIGDALQIGFSEAALGCEWRMTRPAPRGDWSFSTLLDFVAVSGGSAGLRLLGTKGNVTISRRDLMGGSIMLERTDDHDARVADFLGSPPVVLRLQNKAGVISGSFSRDGVRFTSMGEGLAADQLGELVGIGPVASVAHWAADQSRPPARFHRIHQDVEAPVPLNAPAP